MVKAVDIEKLFNDAGLGLTEAELDLFTEAEQTGDTPFSHWTQIKTSV